MLLDSGMQQSAITAATALHTLSEAELRKLISEIESGSEHAGWDGEISNKLKLGAGRDCPNGCADASARIRQSLEMEFQGLLPRKHCLPTLKRSPCSTGVFCRTVQSVL